MTLADDVVELSTDCGRAVPGIELSIDEHDHIVVAGDAVASGSVETGDVGELRDGRLILHGREGEQLQTAAGRTSVTEIESAIAEALVVRSAVVVRDGEQVRIVCQLAAPVAVSWAREVVRVSGAR